MIAAVESTEETLEAALAVQLGIAAAELRSRRPSLIEGEDWHRRGRAVVWTAAGVSRLKELIGLDAGTIIAPAPATPAVVIAEVVRSNFRNRRLISATLARAGTVALVLVLVRDAGMYLHGQRIEVRPNGSGWMEARRPRRRGLF